MKTLKLNEINYPRLVRLSGIFRESHRFSGEVVDRAYSLFGNIWADEFEQVLSSMFSTDQAIIDAAKGYATFSMQSMRLQAVFEREGVYKAKTHQQASDEVYFNETHHYCPVV